MLLGAVAASRRSVLGPAGTLPSRQDTSRVECLLGRTVSPRDVSRRDTRSRRLLSLRVRVFPGSVAPGIIGTVPAIRSETNGQRPELSSEERFPNADQAQLSATDHAMLRLEREWGASPGFVLMARREASPWLPCPSARIGRGDTIANVEADPVPDPATGQAVDRHRVLRVGSRGPRRGLRVGRSLPRRGTVGAGGVGVERNLVFLPCFDDGFYDAPALLGVVAADREQQVAFENA